MKKLTFSFDYEKIININPTNYPVLNDHCIVKNKPVIPIALIISLINNSVSELFPNKNIVINDFKVFKSGTINKDEDNNYLIGINNTVNGLNIMILSDVPCYGCKITFEDISISSYEEIEHCEEVIDKKKTIYELTGLFHGDSLKVIENVAITYEALEADIIKSADLVASIDAIFQACLIYAETVDKKKIIPMSFERFESNFSDSDLSRIHINLAKESNNKYIFNGNLINDRLNIIVKNINCITYT